MQTTYPTFELTPALKELLSGENADSEAFEFGSHILRSVEFSAPNELGTRTAAFALRIQRPAFQDPPSESEDRALQTHVTFLLMILLQLFHRVPAEAREIDSDFMGFQEHASTQLQAALTWKEPYATYFKNHREGISFVYSVGLFADGTRAMYAVNAYEGVFRPKHYIHHVPLFSFTSSSGQVVKEEVEIH